MQDARGAMRFFPVHMSSSAQKAILWKLLACLFFSLSNVLIKSLSLPALQIACCQNFIGGVFLLCILRSFPRGLLSSWSSLARSFISVISVISWTYAIQKLPLFQSVALGFMGPFFTALGAKLFLKENLSMQRSVSIMLGICGGILLMEGSRIFSTSHVSAEENASWLMLVPLCAALSCSLSNILGKKLLHEKFSPQSIACVLMLSVSITLLPSIPLWIWPTGEECALLWLCGIALAFAHWCLGKAFSYTDLSFLLPVGSFKLVLGAWMGVLFFREYPTWWMICGSCVILSSLLVLSWKKHEKKEFSHKHSQ